MNMIRLALIAPVLSVTALCPAPASAAHVVRNHVGTRAELGEGGQSDSPVLPPSYSPEHISSVNAVNNCGRPNSFVYRLTLEPAPVTLELVPGEGDADNHFFRIKGSELRPIEQLPYGKIDYSVRLRATAADGGTFEKTETLIVDVDGWWCPRHMAPGTRAPVRSMFLHTFLRKPHYSFKVRGGCRMSKDGHFIIAAPRKAICRIDVTASLRVKGRMTHGSLPLTVEVS